MEQPQQRKTLFEPEPSVFVEKTPERVVVIAQPVVEKELPPIAEVAESAELESARFNPWLAVLWVLGLVSVGVGVLTNWTLYEQSTISGEMAENFYLFLSLAQTFAPWLFGVGLAAIVGAVLIHALDWQRRHR